MSWREDNELRAYALRLIDPIQNEDKIFHYIDNWVKKRDDFTILQLTASVVEIGYKHQPQYGSNGKPLLRRTTIVHHAARSKCAIVIPNLFKIYDCFRVNYIDEFDFTHFHVACMYGCTDAVERFIKLGYEHHQLINAQDKLGRTPLHVAMAGGCKEVLKLLLGNGADPNLRDTDGFTPLHLICQRNCDDDFMKTFFKAIDDKSLTVHVDAVDEFGRTPLQWAVAKLLPDVVHVLLNRGADLSRFAFPTDCQFGESIESYKESPLCKLKLLSGLLTVIDRLEEKGYEMDHNATLTLVTLFVKHALFERQTDLVERKKLAQYCRSDRAEFVARANWVKIKPCLTLLQLIKLQPSSASKLLTHADYYKFSRTPGIRQMPENILASHDTLLCELMARGFFQRWANECLSNLPRHRLPIECCEVITKYLTNEDLCRVCLSTCCQCALCRLIGLSFSLPEVHAKNNMLSAFTN